ncbi:MAG: hypothetical protein FD180_676 [Planctomycetota bacterium]|nr:MAG: hypothetical protein FD180_676 [Planctomycetota bacterium]
MTKGDKPKGKDPVLERAFRGSWSGYEKDNLFYNPDGPCPRFYNAPYLFGLDMEDDGRSAVPVDIDGDGDLDLMCLGLQGLRLFENRLPPRHFARLRLTASSGHRLALGAHVKVTAGGVTQQDYVKVTDGFQSQLPADLHFGLDAADAVTAVEVRWPTGRVERWENLPADRLIELDEGESAARVSTLPKWPEDSRPKEALPGTPAATATGFDGKRGPLAAPGRPAVLNFWSTTCAPCKRELPALGVLAGRLGPDVSFAGVCVDGVNLDAARGMAEAAGVKYPQFVADEALMAAFFGPGGSAILPSTFVFDARGRLNRVFQREVSDTEIRTLLASMAGDEPSPADLEVRANQLMESGKAAEAVPLLEWSIRIAPSRAVPYSKLGMAWFSLGELQKSIAAIQQSIQLDPDDAYAHMNLGAAFHNADQLGEAIVQYNEALRCGGEKAEFLVPLGRVFAQKNEVARAMEAFDRAIKAEPKSAAAWKWKSRLHKALGQNADAEKCLTMSLALNPSDEEAREWLKLMTGENRR